MGTSSLELVGSGKNSFITISAGPGTGTHDPVENVFSLMRTLSEKYAPVNTATVNKIETKINEYL